jgi:hypothetical protein
MGTLLKWPDRETLTNWRTRRVKRLGPKTGGTVYLFFPYIHPVYIEAAEKARSAVEQHRASMKRAAAGRAAAREAKKAGADNAAPAKRAVAKKTAKPLKPTQSAYVKRMRETNYGRTSK